MSEKPIIFSGPMVRAILEGRKTQTRRVLKPQPWQNEAGLWVWPPPGAKVSKRTWRGFCQTAEADLPGWFDGLHKAAEALPYAPGNRLWVRETWVLETNQEITEPGYDPPHNDGRPVKWVDCPEYGRYWVQPWYRATDPAPELAYDDTDEPACRWRPSIHMPRWASRINLLVTAVRVERLQEISVHDAREEGVLWNAKDGPGMSPVNAFQDLWDSINAKRPGCSWTDNPWVAVISFEVMR